MLLLLQKLTEIESGGEHSSRRPKKKIPGKGEIRRKGKHTVSEYQEEGNWNKEEESGARMNFADTHTC